MGARAVVADDNVTIRLAVHDGAETLASNPLDPVHALALAGELLAAARRRMTRWAP